METISAHIVEAIQRFRTGRPWPLEPEINKDYLFYKVHSAVQVRREKSAGIRSL